MSAPTLSTARHRAPEHARRLAAGTAAAIAAVYLLVFSGALSVGRADEGELGILGVAGVIFLVLAALLWYVRSRVLWAGAAALKVLLAVMYVVIAADREPAFEVWGLTIRGLSAVLLAALLYLLATEPRWGRAAPR
ncbi:hypothetical protein [Egicoccus sp. AB-alg2]|uniref:hypothetical protein n=1 Tax=Egicoccus sp. AB-alg2 TaxID=3242693 RepID=UPI00359D0462